MFDSLISAIWWMAGSGLIFGGLALLIVFYLGKRYLRLAVLIGSGLVIFFGFVGFYRAASQHGAKVVERSYDKAIDKVKIQNRAKKQQVEAAVDGRTEQLEAKIKRIRQKGQDERLWIKGQEKPDGRIDPQTIEVLER